jgi:uncharacterized RDD family membrane protein YckC
MFTDFVRQSLLWRRVLARLVDMASVFFVLWFLVILQVLWFMRDASLRFDPAPWGRSFAPLCAFLALSAVYEVAFLRWNCGQTPGRQLLGTKVVNVRDGSDPSVGCALARWLLPGLALLARPQWAGPVVLTLTAVSVPVSSTRRAIHDLIARTTVVRYEGAAADLDGPDGTTDIPASIDSDMELTMTDVLFGRPGRRALREMQPYRPAGRGVDRG